MTNNIYNGYILLNVEINSMWRYFLIVGTIALQARSPVQRAQVIG